MTWADISPLLELCLPIALAVGWRLLKPYLQSKADSDSREAALRELDTLVGAAVAWRKQEAVDRLKADGNFTLEEQKDSRVKVVVAALNNLSPDSYAVINKHYGKSVEDLVTLLLEKHVAQSKSK